MCFTDKFKKAKEIFWQYDGSYFHMGRDEVLNEYKKYHVPKCIEKKWRYEMLDEAIVNIGIRSDNKMISYNIFKYSQVAEYVLSKKVINKLIECVEINFEKMDSFTVIRALEDIVGLLESLKNDVILRLVNMRETKEYFNKTIIHMIKLMKKNIERGVIIAKERYDGNGGLPSHIVPEEQIQRMNEDIEEWQEMIRHG